MMWAISGKRSDARQAKLALAGGHPLLVLMHGYGSFEGDLIQRAPQLPPEFVCVSPRAPLKAPEPIVDGYSWFPLSLQHAAVQPEEANEYAVAAAESILVWLDELNGEVSTLGGKIEQVALLGFSQGGVMVTQLLRAQPGRFPAGVNCSGFVSPGSVPGDQQLKRLRTPLFWGRDEADPVISREAIAVTEQWAREHTTLTERLYPGIFHGISAEELSDISLFLKEYVPGL